MSDPRPRCPYCNSKQTRHTPSKSNIFTAKFTCRGCGRTFEIDHCGSDPDQPKAKGGCLWSLIKIAAFFIVAAIIFAAIERNGSDKAESNPETQATSSTYQIQDAEAAVEAEHAERAAHEYIPTEEDYKKFEQTQKVHKSDNLTIVETTRASE